MAPEPTSEALAFFRPAHCFEDDEQADKELPEQDGTAGPQK